MQLNCSKIFIILATIASIVLPTLGKICEDSVCEFHLTIRRGRTMTMSTDNATYNVVLNGSVLQVVENSYRKVVGNAIIGSTVSADDVITADGYPRNIIVINDQFPGPTLEVMEGSTVIVHVTNYMPMEAMTIHFHGMHMRGTPWMDGAAMVTQCPIQPSQSFTYRFRAEPAGTHWYHSHLNNQHMDGLYGLFIVHKHLPGVPEFLVTLTDWFHSDALTHYVTNPFAIYHVGSGENVAHFHEREFGSDNVPIGELTRCTGLINGRGRYNHQPFPLATFKVTQGQKYRMRLAHVGTEFSFKVSIDHHMLNIVAVDGGEINPITVDYVIIFAAETVDVEFVADQGSHPQYWLRATTLRESIGNYPQYDNQAVTVRALVSYNNDTDTAEPATEPRECTEERPCRIFNCPFENFPTSRNLICVHMDEARSASPQSILREEYGVEDESPHEVFLNFNLFANSAINGRRFVSPSAPMLQGDAEGYTVECDEDYCEQHGCSCTYILQLPARTTVQLVFSNLQPGTVVYTHHPIHIHGHSFAVMKMGFPHYNQTTGFWTEVNDHLECRNRICASPWWHDKRPTLNRDHPPLKDTVIVPARGYVVTRFKTNNPGYWLMHCHLVLHQMSGMKMVLQEDADNIPPLPRGFPTCFNYTGNSVRGMEGTVASVSTVLAVCLGLMAAGEFLVICMLIKNRASKTS